MKQNGFFLIGILGIILTLLFLGICYQASHILNSINAMTVTDWELTEGYFISDKALIMAILSFLISFISCAIGIVTAKKSKNS